MLAILHLIFIGLWSVLLIGALVVAIFAKRADAEGAILLCIAVGLVLLATAYSYSRQYVDHPAVCYQAPTGLRPTGGGSTHHLFRELYFDEKTGLIVFYPTRELEEVECPDFGFDPK